MLELAIVIVIFQKNHADKLNSSPGVKRSWTHLCSLVDIALYEEKICSHHDD